MFHCRLILHWTKRTQQNKLCLENVLKPKHNISFLKHITKTRLFKYIENFNIKTWKILDKKILIFFIFLLKT